MNVRTTFIDLNWDVHHLIARHLTTYELLSLSEVHKSLHFVIGDVLRQRFTAKVIILSCPFYSREPKHREFYQNEHQDATTFSHLPMIFRVLKHFGPLISRLNFFHECETNATKEIYRLIYSQCAEGLTEFASTSKLNDHFDEFKTPLKNVRQISLEGDFRQLNNSNIKFSDLFPSLTRLIVDPYRSSNVHSIGISDEIMPNLWHLSADCAIDHALPSIKKILSNHPQIRSLYLKHANADLVQFAAEKLPQLEDVELRLYSEENSDGFQFNFERLKRFILNGFTMSFPANFTFGNLEEFQMNAMGSDGATVVNLALQSKESLKKLRLNVHLNSFRELINANLDLVELEFSCGQHLNVNHVIEFIQKSDNLQSVEILFDGDIQPRKSPAFELFQKYLANEWDISKIDYFINLERKPRISELSEF